MATAVKVFEALGVRARFVTALENAGLTTVEEVSAAFEVGSLGSYNGIGPATVAEVELALLCWPDYLAAQKKVDALKDAIHGAGKIPAGATDAREEARASLDAGDFDKAAFWADQGLELFKGGELEPEEPEDPSSDPQTVEGEEPETEPVEKITDSKELAETGDDALEWVSAIHRGAGIIAVPNGDGWKLPLKVGVATGWEGPKGDVEVVLDDDGHICEVRSVSAKDTPARQAGTVKWYSEYKSYGFIAGSGGVDYFVHYSETPATRGLEEGQRVEFEPGYNNRGPLARNVVVIDNSAVPETDGLSCTGDVKFVSGAIGFILRETVADESGEPVEWVRKGERDVFFHLRNLAKENEAWLEEGVEVSFTLVRCLDGDHKGEPHAVNVCGIESETAGSVEKTQETLGTWADYLGSDLLEGSSPDPELKKKADRLRESLRNRGNGRSTENQYDGVEPEPAEESIEDGEGEEDFVPLPFGPFDESDLFPTQGRNGLEPVSHRMERIPTGMEI